MACLSLCLCFSTATNPKVLFLLLSRRRITRARGKVPGVIGNYNNDNQRKTLQPRIKMNCATIPGRDARPIISDVLGVEPGINAEIICTCGLKNINTGRELRRLGYKTVQ